MVIKPLLVWLIPLMGLFTAAFLGMGTIFADPTTSKTGWVVLNVTVILIITWWLPRYAAEVIGITLFLAVAVITWLHPILAPNNAVVMMVILMIVIQYGVRRYRARYAIVCFAAAVGIIILGMIAPTTTHLPHSLLQGLYLSSFTGTIGSTLFQVWKFSQQLYYAHDYVQQINQRLQQRTTELQQALTQLDVANATLRDLALRDPLTGLFNRRYVDETLEIEIHRAQRSGLPIGIMLIDLDHFKHVNDTYGHDMGDALLQAVATLLQDYVRSGDIVARYGGEEFLMVLPGIPRPPLQKRGEMLCAAVRALCVIHNGQALGRCSCSIGIAIYPSHGSDAFGLIKAADQSLYQAKAAGRDCVVVADGTIAPLDGEIWPHGSVDLPPM
ncbi:MAG: hypothetical protein GFH25_541220n50 [Chloroflexi bacterium AL-N10]|nr:hypothetical protein [Chloroflexi bacterium AL-N1]NOK70058.1 hypothetical protein [Chloroflexi bacterium AL-N10]NOK77930.1 hypothetical protein [Chloroflexi bacterium AL-N5]NOK91918.1 hypothetical protein [Chloroflexi bacterium AL-N15]